MISVIIPWCNRQTIATTARLNLPFFQNKEIIVVNFGGNKNDIISAFSKLDIDDISIIHVDNDDGQFNKSMAINIGIWQAQGSYIFILDEDIRICSFDIEEALSWIERQCVVTLGYVVDELGSLPKWGGNLTTLRHLIELSFADHTTALVETSAINCGNFSRSCPGLLMGKRSWFMDLQGYNSDLKGWGWEDIDVLVRLSRLGYQRKQVGWGWHLWEGDVPNPTAEKIASEMANRALALANYAEANFFGSLERDIRKCTAGAVD
jgi:glycosyltransferase involved in cell wall biosynthesis